MSSDSRSFQIMSDMKILEEGSPFRVLVQHGVSETDHLAEAISDDGALIGPERIKTTRPDFATFCDDGTVQVRIQVCAAIVAPPAVGMERRNAVGIVFGRQSVTHHIGRRMSFDFGHQDSPRRRAFFDA